MNALVFQTASELAGLIRAGDVSATDVLAAHLRQCAKHNPRLNAIVTLDENGARQRARAADDALARGEVWGPLHGVPVTIKDCFEVAGLKTTSGFPPLKDYVPTQDATVVARLRAAGAVVMGKTNLSLLATDWQTDNPVFGRTRNPWDETRTPGGSSGGSGAAVAAGLTPLDIGSDIGGSIRVPAHCCGIYGLKPTEHRVPSTGHIPDWYIPQMTPTGVARHMGVYGPLARSVADLQLCLALLSGPDGKQVEVRATPAPTTGTPPPVENLRICWTTHFGAASVSADTAAALESAVGQLERAGARVKQIEPAIDHDALWRVWGEIVGSEIGGSMPFGVRNVMRLQFLLMSDRSPVRKGMLQGVRLSPRRRAQALAVRDDVTRSIDGVLDEFDAWLCPVAATPAITHRRPGKPIDVDGLQISYFLASGGFTIPFNLSGHPVVVLPIAASSAGLPIGVQVVGQRWQDERLLAVAASIDGVIGKLRHPPGFEATA
jgi:amidase